LRSLEGVPVKLTKIATTLLATLVLLVCASPAQASEAQTIIEKCAHGEPFSGYSHKAYREALKQLPTEVSEYSPCPNLIRKAELAAEGGGGGGGTAPGTSPTVALPLSANEQQAVQHAHHSGSAPVHVAGEEVSPGVVHANIASAINTLPHSLFAVLALMLAGVVALVAREVAKRVRARHDS
jgi:hypothetical protein